MRNRLVMAAAASAALAFGSISWAASIGVNFSGGAGGRDQASPPVAGEVDPDSVTGSAGLVSQPNWNNVTGKSGTVNGLVNSAGTATAASLTFNAGGTWSDSTDNPASGNGNRQLLNNYLDVGTGNTGSVTVSNIPYSSYTLYVYTARGETSAMGTGGTDLKTNSPGTFSSYDVVNNGNTLAPDEGTEVRTGNPADFSPSDHGALVEATNSAVGDYIKFTGLSGSTLTLNAETNNNDFRSPVDGIQIVDTSPTVSTPLPASVWGGLGLLGGLLTLTLARKRRSIA